jgi:hypothetical protein
MSKETFESIMNKEIHTMDETSMHNVSKMWIFIEDQQKKIDELEKDNKELVKHGFMLVEQKRNLEAKLEKAVGYVKELRELAIDLWENDASETDWLDVEYYHELIEKTEALEEIEKENRG